MDGISQVDVVEGLGRYSCLGSDVRVQLIKIQSGRLGSNRAARKSELSHMNSFCGHVFGSTSSHCAVKRPIALVHIVLPLKRLKIG